MAFECLQLLPLLLAAVLLFFAAWQHRSITRLFCGCACVFVAFEELGWGIHELSPFVQSLWNSALQLLAAFLFIILPLARLLSCKICRGITKLGLPVAPLLFVPLASIDVIIGHLPILKGYDISEVQETLFYFILAGSVVVRYVEQGKIAIRKEG